MADLESDIIGRVNRLALRPSEKNALLPLMEAVSNSVHSITDLYGPEAAARGRIVVTVFRDGEDPNGRVIGFDVEDNGIGFTDDNFKSFRTPDSRWKEGRGGKGVGRLAWLKVFDRITIDSTYEGFPGWARRLFDFRLSERNQIVEREANVSERAHRTLISFREMKEPFASRFPIKGGTIENRIAAHFVPLFVAGNAPKVTVHDDGITELEKLFGESIVEQQTDTISIGEGDDAFPLTVWSLKCEKRMRFEPPAFNFAFIAGDNRSVIDYSIDEQLGLKALDGELVYVACASSPYLDQKVNSERTAFTLDVEEVDAIKRGIAACSRQFLRPYIEVALRRKVETTRDLIAENPQFLYMADNLDDFAERLQPNAYGKEEIFLEMSRARFRRQKRFSDVGKSIRTGELLKGPLTEKIEEYTGYIADEKRGALAEYVTRRKAVLDLFEKLLEYDGRDTETYSREDALHQLFCPMRIDSTGLTIDDHNLWLLDDRLAFFNFFASDERLSNYTTLDSEERPDLAFFYSSCVAWREREDTDTVVVVEFKRPMREDYAKARLAAATVEGAAPLAPNEDPTAPFSKIAQTVRRTIALRAKLAEDVKTGRADLIGKRAARRTKREDNYFDAKNACIDGSVRRALSEDRPDLDDEAAERLLYDLDELIYDGDEFLDYIDRPVGETVARLCKALGLDPTFCVPDGDGWKIRRKPYAFERADLPPSPSWGGTDGEAVRVGNAEASSGPAGFP